MKKRFIIVVIVLLLPLFAFGCRDDGVTPPCPQALAQQVADLQSALELLTAQNTAQADMIDYLQRQIDALLEEIDRLLQANTAPLFTPAEGTAFLLDPFRNHNAIVAAPSII